MKIVPLENMSQSSPGKVPPDHSRLDLHLDFIVAVLRMEVRRSMIVVVHRDHDPEEAADLRHDSMLTQNRSRPNRRHVAEMEFSATAAAHMGVEGSLTPPTRSPQRIRSADAAASADGGETPAPPPDLATRVPDTEPGGDWYAPPDFEHAKGRPGASADRLVLPATHWRLRRRAGSERGTRYACVVTALIHVPGIPAMTRRTQRPRTQARRLRHRRTSLPGPTVGQASRLSPLAREGEAPAATGNRCGSALPAATPADAGETPAPPPDLATRVPDTEPGGDWYAPPDFEHAKGRPGASADRLVLPATHWRLRRRAGSERGTRYACVVTALIHVPGIPAMTRRTQRPRTQARRLRHRRTSLPGPTVGQASRLSPLAREGDAPTAAGNRCGPALPTATSADGGETPARPPDVDTRVEVAQVNAERPHQDLRWASGR